MGLAKSARSSNCDGGQRALTLQEAEVAVDGGLDGDVGGAEGHGAAGGRPSPMGCRAPEAEGSCLLGVES